MGRGIVISSRYGASSSNYFIFKEKRRWHFVLFPVGSNIPKMKFPWVTLAWGLISVLLFLGITAPELSAPYWETTTFKFSVVPGENNAIWKYFTYQFLHSSWGHLISNLWYLAIFGWILESSLGGILFGFLSLIAGAIAVLPERFFQANPLLPVVGASGAVAFAMGAVFALYPTSRVRLLWTIIPIKSMPSTLFVPIRYLVFFWLFLQVSGLAESVWVHPTSVAYATHLLGFAIGGIVGFGFRHLSVENFFDVDLMGKDLQDFYSALKAYALGRAEEATTSLSELCRKHPTRLQLQKRVFEIAVERGQKDLAALTWKKLLHDRLVLRKKNEIESSLKTYFERFSESPPLEIQEKVRVRKMLHQPSKTAELERLLPIN